MINWDWNIIFCEQYGIIELCVVSKQSIIQFILYLNPWSLGLYLLLKAVLKTVPTSMVWIGMIPGSRIPPRVNSRKKYKRAHGNPIVRNHSSLPLNGNILWKLKWIIYQWSSFDHPKSALIWIISHSRELQQEDSFNLNIKQSCIRSE